MNLPISKRLLACCGYITPGDRVADIGCDHGYLGIHLLQTGAASSVIAADVREMPLQSAIRNAQKYGCREKMQFFLSDGARKIPHDFDTLVCAGMGADTMISILTAAPWLKNSRYRLVLQCQSKIHTLRKFLSSQQWHIEDEAVLRDGRFLYTVMAVRYDPQADPLQEGGFYFSPALLAHEDKETSEYFGRILFSLRRALRHQAQPDPEMTRALHQLEALGEEQPWLKEVPYDDCE